MPEEHRATDMGNMHKNLVKIASVVPEISSLTDRPTDPQTDILITILRNRSRGRSNCRCYAASQYYVRRCGLLLQTKRVCRSVCHSSEPCRNSWTDLDGVWVEDFGGPKDRVLGGVQIAPNEGAIFRPRHALRHCAVSCAKMAEPIEMPFGLWIRLSQRKHVLANTTELSMCGGDAALLSNYFDHLLCLLFNLFTCVTKTSNIDGNTFFVSFRLMY